MTRALYLCLLLAACAPTTHLAHRPNFMLDPQGQGKNLGSEDCKPPRQAYFIYPDGVHAFYLECLNEHINQ